MEAKDLISGRATAEGTAAYARRFPDAAPGHFRRGLGGLTLASIGLGTGGYRRGPSEDSAGLYVEAVQRALLRGVNLVDTAINYGHEFAERVVGAALADLLRRGDLCRAEVVVASKGGYLPFSAEEFERRFVRSGRCSAADLASGEQCLAPAFLLDQLEQSRQNLGLQTIDVYFLHNPEDQLRAVGRGAFASQMRRAFAVLEEAAAHGWIGCYGVATGEGFRSEGEELHRLDEIVGWACEVAGADHHLQVIQLPVNLGMLEAVSRQNHVLGGAPVTVLDVARSLGITVLASASIRRGRFPSPIPEALSRVCPHLQTEAQMALQFTRSLPGVDVALVGMSRPERVEENLRLRAVPPLDLTACEQH